MTYIHYVFIYMFCGGIVAHITSVYAIHYAILSPSTKRTTEDTSISAANGHPLALEQFKDQKEV